MAATRWLFGDGIDGDTLTAELAGADTISLGGGTAVLSDDHSLDGSGLSALMTGVGSGHLWWAIEGLTATSYAVDAYVVIPSYPTTDSYILWAGPTASARSAGILLRAGGTIRLLGNGATVHWTSGTLPTGRVLRISLYATCSSTTGTLRAQWYDLTISDTTPQGDSGTISGVDTQASIDRIRVGRKAASVAGTGPLYILSWAYDPAATDLIPGWSPAGPTVTGTLTAATPTAAIAVPTTAWAGSTSGLPEAAGTLTTTTPTANIATPTATWAGTAQTPSYSGNLDINPDADAITIEVPLSAWSGTTQAPGAAGTLTTTTPAASIATPTLAWAGAATIPESTGSLAGALPIVAITTPTSAWAGATTIPEGDGILAAALPAALVGTPAVAWTGGTTAPVYSGLLDTDTPHALVATPLATWAGASTPPAATTGALDAHLPVVTVHTPAMAQATAGPPPPERTLYIAADDRTLTITSHDRTLTIDRQDRTLQIGAS